MSKQTEIKPQMSKQTEINPQMSKQTEIKPQMSKQTEIKPQMSKQTETSGRRCSMLYLLVRCVSGRRRELLSDLFLAVDKMAL
jgi:hypothetical protein